MDETRTLYRTTDPPSSYEAASGVVKSGRVENNASKVLKALALHPGSTYKQLATHIIGLDRHEVARRLSGLRNKGKVKHCNNLNLPEQYYCNYRVNSLCVSHCVSAEYHKPTGGTRMLKWWAV